MCLLPGGLGLEFAADPAKHATPRLDLCPDVTLGTEVQLAKAVLVLPALLVLVLVLVQVLLLLLLAAAAACVCESSQHKLSQSLHLLLGQPPPSYILISSPSSPSRPPCSDTRYCAEPRARLSALPTRPTTLSAPRLPHSTSSTGHSQNEDTPPRLVRMILHDALASRDTTDLKLTRDEKSQRRRISSLLVAVLPVM